MWKESFVHQVLNVSLRIAQTMKLGIKFLFQIKCLQCEWIYLLLVVNKELWEREWFAFKIEQSSKITSDFQSKPCCRCAKLNFTPDWMTRVQVRSSRSPSAPPPSTLWTSVWCWRRVWISLSRPPRPPLSSSRSHFSSAKAYCLRKTRPLGHNVR